jgi:hypothetical protein
MPAPCLSAPSRASNSLLLYPKITAGTLRAILRARSDGCRSHCPARTTVAMCNGDDLRRLIEPELSDSDS